jgi:hypothetical protein
MTKTKNNCVIYLEMEANKGETGNTVESGRLGYVGSEPIFIISPLKPFDFQTMSCMILKKNKTLKRNGDVGGGTEDLSQ